MKILLDVNVLLDVALDRQPWSADARAVCRACAQGRCDGFVSAVTVPTLFYLAERLRGVSRARDAVRLCLESFEICTVDRAILESAFVMPGDDYEDNVQSACARRAAIDVIVTRNKGDFARSPIPAMSPADLLARLPVR